MKTILKKATPLSALLLPVLVVILVAANLRSPITAVGPALQEVQAALQLDHFQSSLLTSIPLMVFACGSVWVSRYSGRIGTSRLLLYGFIILSLGLLLRASGTVATLFAGSVLIGIGICIGNVIMPGYIKSNFPLQVGIVTGVFAVAMNLTAALASGYSVAIGTQTGYGWRGSLGIWLLPALLAVTVLVAERFRNRRPAQALQPAAASTALQVFKSRQAWNISIFMGLQSLVYYCLVSWLPAVLGDYGMAAHEPGWVLFVIQMAMLPVTFAGPVIANKMKSQRPLIIFIGVLMLCSVLMFAWLRSSCIYLTAILLGVSNGLSFSLAILLFSLRTQSGAHAIKVSGMAQSVGYLIAAFGPPLFGKLHALDASWTTSFYFVAVAVAGMIYFGWQAAGRRFVEDTLPSGGNAQQQVLSGGENTVAGQPPR